MNGKIIFAVIVLVLIVSAGALLIFLTPKTTPTPALSLENVFEAIKGCKDLERNYGIPEAVFEELPKAPKCFASIVELYHQGSFKDDFFFGENFFLQPEFYPKFAQAGLQYWTNPTSTHWGVIGFGSYPFERVLNVKAGSNARARFFLHSGLGVRSFQGLKIAAEFENPQDAGFASIALDSESSEGFLLGPSFPKLDSKWAKALGVEVSIPASSPQKTITVLFKTKAPSSEQSLEWSKSFEKYYDATSFVGEKTIAQLKIRIE